MATYSNTYCIGMGIKIFGTAGEVEITKQNSKSIHFAGTVKNVDTGDAIAVSGKARFWKKSSDGTKTHYKIATGGVVTV